MILVQSNNFELSTNDVLSWFITRNIPFTRLNGEDTIELVSLSMDEGKIKIMIKVNDQVIDFDDIIAYWHRRGKISLKIPEDIKDQLKQNFQRKHLGGLYSNVSSQYSSLENYLNKRLAGLRSGLGDSAHSVINKLWALDTAISCGIDIPPGIITTKKQELVAFREKYGNVITKSILDSVFLWDDDDILVHYTEVITTESLDKLPDEFAPSLIQQAIPKLYELRIFYLNGKVYPMAIFSQSDKQTAVDFRKYNDAKPNRTVRYQLPTEVERNLVELMTKLGLDSGSIDMIVSIEGKFVFLEVNPVGQFGMVSYPCNYYIERDIADYLSQFQKN
jgi:ATP-GRASP peptide maturase of grasp-with-spasm system